MKLKVILMAFFSIISYECMSSTYDEYLDNRRIENNGPFYKLFKAKNFLLEGNLDKAYYFLMKIPDKNDRFTIIKNRYQAIIYFLKNEFKKSLDILEKPIFKKRSVFKEVCLLKIINLLALGKTENLTEEKRSCLTLTEGYTKNDHLWINIILSLKEDDNIRERLENLLNSKYMFSNLENIKIWLKKAIYLNRENKIVNQIKFLPNFALESKKIRELIGLIYYRVGKIEKSLNYLKDLNTTNALNIKGNIEVKKKNYPKAFEYFQKAHKRKEDSLNSILINIPLSYLTQNWQEGSHLLGSLPKDKSEEARKLALDTVFKLRMKDFSTAKKQLSILENYYQGEIPFNVVLMYSYVALLQNDKLPLTKYTHKACTKFDGLSCWLKMQLQTWSNFSSIILNQSISSTPIELDLEKLKSKQKVSGIEEFPVVDQKDIEEIDSMDVIKEAAKFSY